MTTTKTLTRALLGLALPSLASLVLLVAGCGGAAHPTAVAPPRPAPVEPDGKILCALVGSAFRAPVCREPIDEKIAAHRPSHEVLFREHGRIVRHETRNSSGALDPNVEGVSIRQFVYEGPRLREEVQQDADGNVLYRIAYSDTEHATYLDRQGRKKAPFGDRDATGYTTKYDDRGNAIEVMYVDADGKPSTGGEQTFITKRKYDQRNRLVAASYYSGDGRPMLSRWGYHSYEIEYHLDCERSRRLRGLRGERVLGSVGHSGFLQTCDAAGNVMDVRFLGVNDEPRVNENGVAGWAIARDDRGNMVEKTYVSLTGATTAGTQDHAIERFEYDRNGRKIAQHNLAPDGTPAPVVRTSVASFRYTYDAGGRVLTESLRGVTGRRRRASTAGR